MHKNMLLALSTYFSVFKVQLIYSIHDQKNDHSTYAKAELNFNCDDRKIDQEFMIFFINNEKYHIKLFIKYSRY